MFEFEGSRSEFLKLLAECGEEPAFLSRARAPALALDALLRDCNMRRKEMLRWPDYHLSVLSQQIANDWSRLAPLLVNAESVTMLERSHASLNPNIQAGPRRLATTKGTLRQFLQSAERFNRNWRNYIERLDLEPVNKPRRDFNEYYLVEKACAFGNERVADGFEPLGIIDRAYLYAQFPLLELPALR